MAPNIGTGLGWMAWTWQTALFFGVIALLLVLLTVLEIRRPGGNERRGALGIVTTRGDRLFISLLAAGFIHLLWLAFFGTPLWGASVLALALAAAVFRWV
jgi:predicted small integral membrane protein